MLKVLGDVLNAFHFISLFLPVIIYFLPVLFIKRYAFLFKYYLLIMMLIPIHWVFLDNRCLFTMVSRKTGALQNTETTSQFSEVYLKWLYKPIMTLFGWEWNSKGLDKMVTLHMGINFILIWYFIFFYARKQLF